MFDHILRGLAGEKGGNRDQGDGNENKERSPLDFVALPQEPPDQERRTKRHADHRDVIEDDVEMGRIHSSS